MLVTSVAALKRVVYEAKKPREGLFQSSWQQKPPAERRVSWRDSWPCLGLVLSVTQLLNTVRLNLIIQCVAPADLNRLLWQSSRKKRLLLSRQPPGKQRGTKSSGKAALVPVRSYASAQAPRAETAPHTAHPPFLPHTCVLLSVNPSLVFCRLVTKLGATGSPCPRSTWMTWTVP